MEEMIIGVVGLKGGTGKTVTAIYLAAAAQKQGKQVTVIDADSEQSALNWASGELDFAVVPADKALSKQAKTLKKAGHVVLIDNSPNSRDLLYSTALCSDRIVVPTGATGQEVNRLAPTLQILHEVEESRGTALTSILLTKYDRRRVLSREFLEVFAEYPLLDTKISHKAIYQSEFGMMPTYTLEYSNVLWELTNENQASEN